MSDDRIDKLEDKIDKVLDIAIKQEVNLERLTTTVEYHAKRSDTLEDLYHHLDAKIDAEIEPLKASALKTKTIANITWKVFIYVVIPLTAAILATMHFSK